MCVVEKPEEQYKVMLQVRGAGLGGMGGLWGPGGAGLGEYGGLGAGLKGN